MTHHHAPPQPPPPGQPTLGALGSKLLRPLLASRPVIDGTLRLKGLRAPLTIRRDRHAVPYIEAQYDEDAWFGLGFCQGQDRAFQLELRLRTVRGTLSQLFGDKTIAIDRLARRVGFIASSRRQLDVLDLEVRWQIEAFVRGVNAGLELGMRRRPLEFTLLGATPTTWEPADVLAQGKLLSFMLIGNWDVELARLRILLTDGEQALRDLDPAWGPTQGPGAGGQGPGRAPGVIGIADRLGEDLAAFAAFAGTAAGSNAWAVAGTKTASGRPLLANDPHLEPDLPPHWYLAQIRTPDWSVAGAALVGAPGIGAGHNGFAAWGVTAGLADTVDLFMEEVASDGPRVRRGDGYEDCEVRREVIEVKGGASIVEEVLETPRGPVIGPALSGEVGAISLRATWLDARPARGFLVSHKARSFEAFRADFAQWPLLSQNVVYADETGRIAWLLAGEAPQRRKGSGTLPQHAADTASGWHEDTVPFASMPYVTDPAAGIVVSANQPPLAPGEGKPFLGIDWLDSYRADRISEALSSRDGWDVEAFMALQMDETTLAWRDLKDTLLAAQPATEAGRKAQTLLSTWRGALAKTSSAASVFEMVVMEMWRRMAKSRAPQSWEYALGRGFDALLNSTTFAPGRWSRMVQNLNFQPEGWFQRPWSEEIGDAFDVVAGVLTERFGEDDTAWAWGTIRQLTLEHPLGVVKQLAPLLNRGPYAWGGDGNTISQASTGPRSLVHGNPGVIASLRFAVEVGAWENAMFCLPGGQSGDPLSRYYDDLIPRWLNGHGIQIAWSSEAIARGTTATLELIPLGGK